MHLGTARIDQLLQAPTTKRNNVEKRPVSVKIQLLHAPLPHPENDLHPVDPLPQVGNHHKRERPQLPVSDELFSGAPVYFLPRYLRPALAQAAQVVPAAFHVQVQHQVHQGVEPNPARLPGGQRGRTLPPDCGSPGFQVRSREQGLRSGQLVREGE